MDLDAVVEQFRRQQAGIQPGTTMKRETPTRAAQVGSDVMVPFLRAFISGLFVFGLAGMFCIALSWPVWAAGIPAFFAAAAFWFGQIWDWNNLLWAIEEITNLDINRDGYEGQPETHYELRLSPAHWIRGKLPVPDDVMLDWARSAMAGESLAYSTWESRFALPNGTSGREAYAEFRSKLVRDGLAREVGGNVGLQLTRKGMAVMGGFARASREDAAPLLDARGQGHHLAVPHMDTHTGIQGGR